MHVALKSLQPTFSDQPIHRFTYPPPLTSQPLPSLRIPLAPLQLTTQASWPRLTHVIYDKNTGRSRGFGFVTVSSSDEFEAAAQQFNGYEIDGRALRVNYGPPPPGEEGSFSRGGTVGGIGDGFDSGNCVYVGNLPWSVDNLTLENLFSEQGKVLEAKVVYDREW